MNPPVEPLPKLTAAIYARYSCENQRETSIEDQIRRCKEVAENMGLGVSQWLIYSDSALSGQAYTFNKRQGMQDLLSAWDKQEFSLLLVDAFERLSREGIEHERLIQRLKTNRRVRLITADGVDTDRPGWEFMLRIKGAVSQVEVSNLQHRVGRGMEGQLERGYMIATPCYGYDLKREFDAHGNRLGTHWVINEAEARIVKEIFDRRKAGQSMQTIATWLNGNGVPCARPGRKTDGGYWRPSRIRNLLSNTIYRGEFGWHGSTTYRCRAEKRGDSVKEKTYARPQLRLVSDDTWHLCNSKVTRSGYGGGRHVFAGLISCGHCGATLVISSLERCRSVYCANCTIAKGCTQQSERLSVTVATVGVQALLTEALQFFLSPELVQAFHQALQEKLTGQSQREHEICEAEVKRLRRAQSRLAHMLANIDNDDDILIARYEETRRLASQAESKLDEMSARRVEIDEAAIAKQLSINPSTVLAGLFDADLPPERLRATLARLFPSIVLEGKTGRYSSIFRIKFAAGTALALATETEAQMEESIERRFMLRYIPNNSCADKRRWEVTLLAQGWIPAEQAIENTQT